VTPPDHPGGEPGGGAGRPLAAAWMLLAVLALALSTVCAVLLVLGRAPLPPALAASPAGFRSALVLHVNLAVIVWFLCCAAALWTLAAGCAPRRWSWAAPALAGAGLTAMLAAPFGGQAAPVLANYVPVLDSPLFLGGLLLLLAGVLLAALDAAVGLWRRPGPLAPWRLGAGWSMAAVLTAAGALAASLWQAGPAHDAAGFEALAWGPGHLLQFVHILLLMSVWSVLADGGAPVRRAAEQRVWQGRLAWLLALAALPLLAAPLIYLNWPAGSIPFRLALTGLMRWGSWPAAAVLALRLLWPLLRAGRAACLAQLPLLLSLLLFLLGCVLGALIRSDTTMVPAHYHGTVGAVTLGYMALGYRLLPGFGAAMPAGWRLRGQVAVYGGGLITLALGLAWSGALGAPRKTVYADLVFSHPAYLAAMALAGLGGLLAVLGAAWYVGNIARACGPLLRRRLGAPLLGGATATVLLSGALLALWPATPLSPQQLAEQQLRHVRTERAAEVAHRFAAGTALLTQRRYEEAASAWHRVLELAPRLPEAQVNMGYTMLGLGRDGLARDFFVAAIELNKKQDNAYFGLALALDALGDRAGALGAMRSYVHLSPSDDAYRRRAYGAIWEWEAARTEGTPAAPTAIPEIGKLAARAPMVGNHAP
jgi:cytochrome c oxidase subunit I